MEMSAVEKAIKFVHESAHDYLGKAVNSSWEMGNTMFFVKIQANKARQVEEENEF